MVPILVDVGDRANVMFANMDVMFPNNDIEVGTFTSGSELVVTKKAAPSGPDFGRIKPSSDISIDQKTAQPRLTE